MNERKKRKNADSRFPDSEIKELKKQNIQNYFCHSLPYFSI